MPVTHAHPAAVLPLIVYGRRIFSASALVIGSMAPDLPYFFFLDLSRKETHNLSGIFLWCLPLGLCVYALYHWFLRPALLDHFSPHDWQANPAFSEPRGFTFSSLIVIVISLIIGAATHNFWDSLTHGTGWFPERYSIFHEHFWPVRSYPLYRVLQYLSGIFGTIIVVWFFLRTLASHQLILWQDRAWRKSFLIRTLRLLAIAAAAGAIASLIYVQARGHISSSSRSMQLLRFWIICSTDFVVLLGLFHGLRLRLRKEDSRNGLTPVS
ncbi:MAG TPA: DUF4184 family protein [Verrucomicrobiae bacterium]